MKSLEQTLPGSIRRRRILAQIRYGQHPTLLSPHLLQRAFQILQQLVPALHSIARSDLLAGLEGQALGLIQQCKCLGVFANVGRAVHLRQVVAAQRTQPKDVSVGLQEEFIFHRCRGGGVPVEVLRRTPSWKERHGPCILKQSVVKVRHFLEVLQRQPLLLIPAHDALGQIFVSPHDQFQLLVFAISENVLQLELLGIYGGTRFESG
mmetsp:Transcript_7606/g.13810  ORF Transcript_7606/g.13810 Transcript_7606/m.13810 type:complete len:207 (-) Transcript_7606:453-1073(-)